MANGGCLAPLPSCSHPLGIKANALGKRKPAVTQAATAPTPAVASASWLLRRGWWEDQVWVRDLGHPFFQLGGVAGASEWMQVDAE